MELNELSAVHTPERWKAALYEKLRQEHPHPVPALRRLGVVLAAALLLLAAAAFAWLVEWNGAADYFGFLAGEDAPAYVDVEQLRWDTEGEAVTAYEDELLRIDVLEASCCGKVLFLLLEVTAKNGMSMENCYFDSFANGHATDEFLFTGMRWAEEYYIYPSDDPGLQENVLRVYIQANSQREYEPGIYPLWLHCFFRQGETRAEVLDVYSREMYMMEVEVRERPELARYIPVDDMVTIGDREYRLTGFQITPFCILGELSVEEALGADAYGEISAACMAECRQIYVEIEDGSKLTYDSSEGLFIFDGALDIPAGPTGGEGVSKTGYFVLRSGLPLNMDDLKSITVFGKTYLLNSPVR